MASKIGIEESNRFINEAFPGNQSRTQITHLAEGEATVRLVADDTHLRPGNYISGPTQMSLADTAAYFAVMSLIGLEPMTVTSNLNINFLRPCIGTVVVAHGEVMKIGAALAVIEVDIRIEGAEKASSHAIVTYAIPRKEARA
ncbi:MAG: PaaI family thioesterase [Hyphomonas sp.]|uniref:PaaI family thioesterase n=1 Tax=Hyphomonas sp. TaxID=87 RepID=UPI0035283705